MPWPSLDLDPYHLPKLRQSGGGVKLIHVLSFARTQVLVYPVLPEIRVWACLQVDALASRKLRVRARELSCAVQTSGRGWDVAFQKKSHTSRGAFRVTFSNNPLQLSARFPRSSRGLPGNLRSGSISDLLSRGEAVARFTR